MCYVYKRFADIFVTDDGTPMLDAIPRDYTTTLR